MKDYYGGRWKLFVSTLTSAVRSGVHVDFQRYA